MSLEGGLIMAEVHGALDKFMGDKEDSSLEITDPIYIKPWTSS